MKETVEITSVAHGGHGICRIDGQVCFVPFALPGDTAEISVVEKRRGVLWGKVEKITTPSPHRKGPECPVFGQCGGCSWLNASYDAQVEWKKRIVNDAFERIAGIEVELGWQAEPELCLGYRTRAEFHGLHGECGFYASSTRTIVDIDACPLCHPNLNSALARLRTCSFAGSVEITVSPESDDVLVWTKRPNRRIRKLFPTANFPRDKRERAGFVFDGVPIVNGTFSQSSLLLNRLLVETTHEAVGEAERVLDLYCGNGNLSLCLDNSSQVLGLDHSWPAVNAANQMGDGEYRRGGTEEFLKALSMNDWDLVLLDPPRTGAKQIMAGLTTSQASAIVYVSCEPSTLARDVKILAAHGWSLVTATAIDMFPNTPHVETVCRLER